MPILISIHAPREGSDMPVGALVGLPQISIHAPREGSDVLTLNVKAQSEKFLSTLPARGATAATL